ncbi:MAG: ABC transporter permease, partial [Bacteroidota bacterium]
FLLSFVFGTIAKVEVGDTPHLLFTIAGMCSWNYFSAVFAQAGSSIIGAQNMIKKIYFPRLIIPLSKALTALVDFAIVLFLLFALLSYYRYPVGTSLLWLPFFMAMTILTGLTGGIWMSVLTIRYRDFQHTIPFLLRIGLFVTPIAFPVSAVPENYKLLFFLNPMVGIVEGFRWSVLGLGQLDPYTWISFALIGCLFFAGLFYFHRVEKIMADIL